MAQFTPTRELTVGFVGLVGSTAVYRGSWGLWGPSSRVDRDCSGFGVYRGSGA